MHKSVLLASGTIGVVVVCLLVACGSSDDSTFGNDNDSGSSGGFSDALGDGNPDAGDPYANDLPPPLCPAPDTVNCCKMPNPPTPPIGGSAECPDDKNKPGCACQTPGQMAACWTGLRKNRNLGVCKDGVTTCQRKDETTYAWGPCEGEVLPTPGATKGAAACACFSQGQWLLSNLSPCFFQYCDVNCNMDPDKSDPTKCDPNGNCVGTHLQAMYGISTVDGMPSACPAFTGTAATGPNPPPATPPWSTTKLNIDCEGHFKLCYALKAGDFKNPQKTDCTFAKVCTEGDYLKAGVVQDFGSLGNWVTKATDQTCVEQWYNTGGYGEMTVVGESVRCEPIDDGMGNEYVFNRIQYCPSKCENGMNATDPACMGCKQDGSGMF